MESGGVGEGGGRKERSRQDLQVLPYNIHFRMQFLHHGLVRGRMMSQFSHRTTSLWLPTQQHGKTEMFTLTLESFHFFFHFVELLLSLLHLKK